MQCSSPILSMSPTFHNSCPDLSVGRNPELALPSGHALLLQSPPVLLLTPYVPRGREIHHYHMAPHCPFVAIIPSSSPQRPFLALLVILASQTCSYSLFLLPVSITIQSRGHERYVRCHTGLTVPIPKSSQSPLKSTC